MVARKGGYHGRVVNRAKGDTDCARCHTEHLGENFRIIRWPTSKDEFDHREASYPLLGRHAALHCEQCHNPKFIPAAARSRIQAKDLTRTFEGVTSACLTCHQDQHRGQLAANCQNCHGFWRWKPFDSFDHDKTRYRLTGKHTTVTCDKCHKPIEDTKVIQYTKLNFAECSGCHQDPHHGAFVARCESCHATTGWKKVEITTNTFDHSKTKFPLNGKHAAVACDKCHKNANFKTPVAHEKCMDCHQDQHKGQFRHRADGGECGPCHTDAGWKPSKFKVTEHQTTAYPLAGKHIAVVCAKCHLGTGVNTDYHPRYKACLDCHKDPHGAQFDTARDHNQCDKCHTVDGFEPSTFTLTRHQATEFALKGAHAAVACQDCHRKGDERSGRDRQYHFESLACEACHQDPHSGQFPAVIKARFLANESVCESCHTLRSWRDLRLFDHSTTEFALTGAHRSLTCMDCHRPVSPPGLAALASTGPLSMAAAAPPPGAATMPSLMVPATTHILFDPAPKECSGCHEDIHGGQFVSPDRTRGCAGCHDSVRWTAALFDHNRGTDFSLTGAHANVPCRLCHTGRKVVQGRGVVVYKGTPRECSACHKK